MKPEQPSSMKPASFSLQSRIAAKRSANITPEMSRTGPAALSVAQFGPLEQRDDVLFLGVSERAARRGGIAILCGPSGQARRTVDHRDPDRRNQFRRQLQVRAR